MKKAKEKDAQKQREEQVKKMKEGIRRIFERLEESDLKQDLKEISC